MMTSVFRCICVTLMLSSCALGAGDDDDSRVGGKTDIYGNDSRKEPYEFPADSIERKSASATMAVIRMGSAIDPTRDLRLRATTLGQDYGLCEGVAFADQPTLASCSAFWVGKDIVVTAGHCIEESDCSQSAFVLDFALERENDPRVFGSTITLPKETIYACKKVLAREDAPEDCTRDYAIVQLHREISGRTPLRYQKRGSPERGLELFAVGHPTGLPAKVATEALVRTVDSTTFGYELDLFGGNSGSAVFDRQGVVRGIHMCGGEGDYTADPAPWNDYIDVADGVCQVPIQCDEYCGELGYGFDISQISAQLDAALSAP